MSTQPMEAATFRRLMAHWATGVSVITCLGDDGPVGCTANSLTSLSLDPPRVLVCFDQTARTLESVRTSGRFGVSILTDAQEALGRRFASREPQEEKFRDVPIRMTDGTVVLDDCMATIICDVAEILSHGDHRIVIADVVQGTSQEGNGPLLFFRSAFSPMPASTAPAPARSSG